MQTGASRRRRLRARAYWLAGIQPKALIWLIT
jgi:hypothetical protein